VRVLMVVPADAAPASDVVANGAVRLTATKSSAAVAPRANLILMNVISNLSLDVAGAYRFIGKSQAFEERYG
jgi:hypothetical protein